jgi:hypothetical protein
VNRLFRGAHADPRNAQAKLYLFVPKLRRLPIQARLIEALQLRKYHIFRAMAPPESAALIEKLLFLFDHASNCDRRCVTMRLSDVRRRITKAFYFDHSIPPVPNEAARRYSNRLLGVYFDSSPMSNHFRYRDGHEDRKYYYGTHDLVHIHLLAGEMLLAQTVQYLHKHKNRDDAHE